MIKLQSMSAPANQDADLVRASLAGQSDAFARIIRRYQSLICSLAYSATGSLNRSEDLAQETFVTAWRKLPELREPTKLRAWLCGIARHLISNAQRRAGHEPAHLAGPLDAVSDAIAAEPSPPEAAVTREEEAIMWRALEKIPETYREPLVLFYREHRSVEEVACELELSDDAVKQRLARGRALLHEQVLLFVEGTLQRSRPGQKFTGSVLAALPVMGTGAIAAAGAGYATGQGAASAKGASWLAPLATVITAQVLWFVSLTAFVFGLGGLVGWQMADPGQSPAERRWARWFWRLLAIGTLVWLVPESLWEKLARAYPPYAGALSLWLGLFYVVIGVPFVLWAVANHHRIRWGTPAVEPAAAVDDKTLRLWVALPTVYLLGMLVVGLVAARWDERVRPDEVGPLIAAHPAAQICVDELGDGHRWVAIDATEHGSSHLFRGPLNEATFLRLKQSGRPFTTRVQGRDYDVLGWPARRLGLITLLAIGAGAMFLGRPRTRAAIGAAA